MQEIVERAQGVFLWVNLVVKSLLSGLGNRDDIADLQRRLRLLPTELEDLYEKMLFRRADEFYDEKASQTFHIVQAARGFNHKKPRLASTSLSILPLSYAGKGQNFAIDAKIEALSAADATKRCRLTEDRIMFAALVFWRSNELLAPRCLWVKFNTFIEASATTSSNKRFGRLFHPICVNQTSTLPVIF